MGRPSTTDCTYLPTYLLQDPARKRHPGLLAIRAPACVLPPRASAPDGEGGKQKKKKMPPKLEQNPKMKESWNSRKECNTYTWG